MKNRTGTPNRTTHTERCDLPRRLLARTRPPRLPSCGATSHGLIEGIAILLVGLAALTLAALHTKTAMAQGDQPPDHGRSNCHMCHSDPDLVGKLGDGELIDLYVDPAVYYPSVHGLAGLECLACHADQRAYPHQNSQISCSDCHVGDPSEGAARMVALQVDLPYPNRRALTLEANETCRLCHDDKFEEAKDSAHARVLAGGNPDAPVCVDCHGSHDITPPDQPRSRISSTCATCHRAVYTTYRSSVHGEALIGEGNPDVPTCVDCHGVHSVRGPRDPSFRNDSIAICGGCHADEERMSKYDISTQVFQTYLNDFHGRSVDLFRRQSPNRPSTEAVCFDCHGIHNIRRPDDPLSTVYPSNLQHTCQQCHPDANITFPQAWLSHYTPTWQNNPVLYAVTTFYRIMIPLVIGGFLAYIALDGARRLMERRRKWQAEEMEDLGTL